MASGTATMDDGRSLAMIGTAARSPKRAIFEMNSTEKMNPHNRAKALASVDELSTGDGRGHDVNETIEKDRTYGDSADRFAWIWRVRTYCCKATQRPLRCVDLQISYSNPCRIHALWN